MKRRSIIQSPVLSFVLCSRTRERTRARKSIASLVVFIRRGKHHPSRDFSFTARAFKRERDARKTREEREQRHHDSPNFDASLGNDVHANGLRNSGLGNREHYVYECVSEYKMARYLCFFLSFRWKTAALRFDTFVSTERENMFIFESRLFLDEFLLLFFQSVAVLFFRKIKQAKAAF